MRVDRLGRSSLQLSCRPRCHSSYSIIFARQPCCPRGNTTTKPLVPPHILWHAFERASSISEPAPGPRAKYAGATPLRPVHHFPYISDQAAAPAPPRSWPPPTGTIAVHYRNARRNRAVPRRRATALRATLLSSSRTTGAREREKERGKVTTADHHTNLHSPPPPSPPISSPPATNRGIAILPSPTQATLLACCRATARAASSTSDDYLSCPVVAVRDSARSQLRHGRACRRRYPDPCGAFGEAKKALRGHSDTRSCPVYLVCRMVSGMRRRHGVVKCAGRVSQV